MNYKTSKYFPISKKVALAAVMLCACMTIFPINVAHADDEDVGGSGYSSYDTYSGSSSYDTYTTPISYDTYTYPSTSYDTYTAPAASYDTYTTYTTYDTYSNPSYFSSYVVPASGWTAGTIPSFTYTPATYTPGTTVSTYVPASGSTPGTVPTFTYTPATYTQVSSLSTYVPATPAPTPGIVPAYSYTPATYLTTGPCSFSASPTVVTFGNSTTLSWVGPFGTPGWITGVGYVSSSGTTSVTPARTQTYIATFTNVYGQTMECATTVSVIAASGITASVVSVALAAVPYTGLDLGPVGLVIYWSVLILFCIVAAYQLAVKCIHMKFFRWLKVFLFGDGAATKIVEIKNEKAVPAAMPVPTPTPSKIESDTADKVDDFIAQQLTRMGKR